jgi:hypothetical protein
MSTPTPHTQMRAIEDVNMLAPLMNRGRRVSNVIDVVGPEPTS